MMNAHSIVARAEARAFPNGAPPVLSFGEVMRYYAAWRAELIAEGETDADLEVACRLVIADLIRTNGRPYIAAAEMAFGFVATIGADDRITLTKLPTQ